MMRITRVSRLLILIVTSIGASTQSFADADDTYRLRLVEAQPEEGFNFPYFLRIPNAASTFEKQYLIVATNNSGNHDDFSVHLEKTKQHVTGAGPGAMMSNDLSLPLLMPVFPRSKTKPLIYTHALDSDTLGIQSGPLTRLDLQLVNMVEHARKQLAAVEIQVEMKFIMVGFSASGTASNRFAFLHPEKLLAVSSGAVNAFPMLPISKVGNATFDYPLGVANLAALSGADFKKEQWQALPQMIYMGALDDNDALRYTDAYSHTEQTLVFEHIGEDMRQRWNKSQDIYLANAANVTFITFGKVGHWTNGAIRRNIASFLRSAIAAEIYRLNSAPSLTN